MDIKDEVSRNEIGKLISEIYFDGSIQNFCQQAYLYAINSLMYSTIIVDNTNELNTDQTFNEGEEIWEFCKEDVNIIIEKSIKRVEAVKKLDDEYIPINKILLTEYHGKRLKPKYIGSLPFPSTNLSGIIFQSSQHFIQRFIYNEDIFYYLRDTENQYFFKFLFLQEFQVTLPHNQEILSYTVLGRSEEGTNIIVGLNIDNKWRTSLFMSEEIHDWEKMDNHVKLLIDSHSGLDVEATLINIENVILKETIQDLESRGYIIRDKELLNALGGNPNALSDDEFEVVFGQPR